MVRRYVAQQSLLVGRERAVGGDRNFRPTIKVEEGPQPGHRRPQLRRPEAGGQVRRHTVRALPLGWVRRQPTLQEVSQRAEVGLGLSAQLGMTLTGHRVRQRLVPGGGFRRRAHAPRVPYVLCKASQCGSE